MPAYIAIDHIITAGSQFTGVAAGGVGTDDDFGMRLYASDVLGGLFDDLDGIPRIVEYVQLRLADATTYTLSVVTSAGDVVWKTHVTAPLDGSGNAIIVEKLVLWADETLKLETTGASAAMGARVVARRL